MYKSIIASIAPLVVTLILFVVVGNFGLNRVRSLRAEISQARLDNAALAEKLSTLRTVNAEASSGSQFAASALPGSNPVLGVISQIKNISTQNAVVLTNLKSSTPAEDSTGLSKIDVNFDVTGSLDSIIAFLQGMGKVAPISLVDKIKLTQSAGQVRATVTIKSYWADLPTKLPTLTQPVTDLTPDEKTLLTKISALSQPQFVEIPPSQSSGKANPFAP